MGDIWSLGICLFAMCVGFFPLEVADETDWRFVQLQQAQRQGDCSVHTILGYYNQSCTLSPPLVQLLNKMLSIQADQRPTAEEVLRHTWLAEQQAKDRSQSQITQSCQVQNKTH